MPDGLHRGEFFDDDFCGGRGFGERAKMPDYVPRTRFGEDAGDTVTVKFDADASFDAVTVRYRTTSDVDGEFDMTVVCGSASQTAALTLSASAALTTATAAIKSVSGSVTLMLTSRGCGGVEFDVAILHSRDDSVTFTVREPEFEPIVTETENGDVISYPEVGERFGFSLLTDSYRVRRVESGTLEDALPSRLSQADPSFDRLQETFSKSFERKKSDAGFYRNYIVHSIFIGARSHHVEYALICDEEPRALTQNDAEAIYERARARACRMNYNGDGKHYEFSARMLNTALLTNIVYPVYRHGEYVRHHTPGKRWDSFYTWDSGFIGLGLLETDKRLAQYVLEMYLSEHDNDDFAFLMHGSPVPVQIYLYLELLQRENDKSALTALYPRVRRMYRYLAGLDEGSVTDMFESGLCNTFTYFYNCSGMDDLPPQVKMHAEGMEDRCAPALTTSQIIRAAKILRMTARELGFDADAVEYERDIKKRADALLRYAWDEDSGYFGYVVHDSDGEPVGIYRTESGENLSRGMDGVYPLVAGICTDEQEACILSHIFSEREMWSRVGISAVDMSASYYVDDGYWNGNVWFSHQWFLWKTMLDLGRGELAYKIAKRALDCWSREVGATYYTFEMLNIKTGRGGWFHHFGGLSSPISIWGAAYFRAGTVTCGFDMWISEQSYVAACDAMSVTVTSHASRPCAMIVTLRSADGVRAYMDGEEIATVRRTDGAVEIMVPPSARCAKIEITHE